MMWVVDTPGVLVPRIDDSETGLKLGLTGAIKEEIIGPELLVDYWLFLMNKLSCFHYVQKYEMAGPVDRVEQLMNVL